MIALVRWRERNGVRWLAAELPGATAAFSARLGGTSSGPFATLNLGLRTGDRPAAVTANRAALTEAVGRDPAGVLIGAQVHEATMLQRDVSPHPNPWTASDADAAPPSDGQATAAANLTPASSPIACRLRSSVRAGWRCCIAAGAGSPPGSSSVGWGSARGAAAIGPGIGRCCYEVGEEVGDAFAPLGDGIVDRVDARPARGRAAAARSGRGEAGRVAALCTSCDPELFFSHRRDGARTGRQAGLVWIDG